MRRRRRAASAPAASSDIFEDIFGDMMGGGRRGARPAAASAAPTCATIWRSRSRRPSPARPRDRRADLVTCTNCAGSGAKPGTQPVTCRICNGHGKVRAAQGFFTIERTCPICQGRGQTIEDPCTDCGGQGRVTEERTLSVNIPAGIEDGTRIRLANEGEAGLRGGPPGDLYIFLSVKPHEFFQRDGADLYCTRADRHDHGGARRRVRGADARRHADAR